MVLVIAKLTEEKNFESEVDSNMAVEPIASDSDDPDNLSNISSDDELSTTNNSTPNINNTLTDMYKSSYSNTSNASNVSQ